MKDTFSRQSQCEISLQIFLSQKTCKTFKMISNWWRKTQIIFFLFHPFLRSQLSTVKSSLNEFKKTLKVKFFYLFLPSGQQLTIAFKELLFHQNQHQKFQFHNHIIWQVFWEGKIRREISHCAVRYSHSVFTVKGLLT